jgi:hypothetical protein
MIDFFLVEVLSAFLIDSDFCQRFVTRIRDLMGDQIFGGRLVDSGGSTRIVMVKTTGLTNL